MKHYLEIGTKAQATKKLRPGDIINCADHGEVVTEVEIPAMWTAVLGGKEIHHFCTHWSEVNSLRA